MAFFILGFILFVTIYITKYYKLNITKLQIEKEQELSLLEATIKSQERERKRIGEDIHDTVSPELLSALRLLNTEVPILEQPIQEKVIKAVQRIELGMGRLSSISHDLHPGSIETFGLVSGLEDFCRNVLDSFGCTISVSSPTSEIKLSVFHQVLIFRIIQELVYNSINHGQADQFNIYINEYPTHLILRITSNGRPFLMSDYFEGLKRPDSLGLKNVEQRLKILEGNIEFRTRAQVHTAQLTFPLK